MTEQAFAIAIDVGGRTLAVEFALEPNGIWCTRQLLHGGRASRIIGLSPIEEGELLILGPTAERFRPLLCWRRSKPSVWERSGSGYVLRTRVDAPAGSMLALRDLEIAQLMKGTSDGQA